MGFGSFTSNNIKVFRNLAVDGDRLYVFHYKITFTDDLYPDETAPETISFRLYDAAGTLKATFKPYVYPYFNTNGYGDGIGAVYFESSADAPEWGTAAELNIDGWPAYYTGLTAFTYTLLPEDYIDSTTQEDNQDQLKELIFLWCDRLDAIYSDTGVVLKSASDIGNVLSTYGESYFSGVIEGLQAMCPEIFFMQVYVPERMDVSYNMTMGDTFGGRLSDTSEWKRGLEHIGESIGVSTYVVITFLFAIISIAACVFAIKKGWGIEPGAGISALICIAGAILFGNVLLAILMIVSLVAVIAIVWLLLLRRTS